MAGIPKTAIITTPRGRQDNMGCLLHIAEGLRASFPKEIFCFGVAMPRVMDEWVKNDLQRLLSNTGFARTLYGEMSPRAQGTGQIYQMACELAFRESAVGWVIHLPIDLDASSRELIFKLRDLVEKVKQITSGIVVGDFIPEHAIKIGIEDHVIEQLRYYFRENVIDRLGIGRPRSEFFCISRDLYDAIVKKNLWATHDPIPGVLLFADANGFGVDKVDLGVFREVDYNPAPESIRWQIWRTALQTAVDYLRLGGFEDPQKSVKIAQGMQMASEAETRLLARMVSQ
jgi:hypothetical protein